MPFKCTLLLLVEDADGVTARIAHWDNLPDNTPAPPNPPGLAHSIANGQPAATATNRRHATTRTILKTLFGQFVDSRYTNTPA